jgi:hypothetical protein
VTGVREDATRIVESDGNTERKEVTRVRELKKGRNVYVVVCTLGILVPDQRRDLGGAGRSERDVVRRVSTFEAARAWRRPSSSWTACTTRDTTQGRACSGSDIVWRGLRCSFPRLSRQGVLALQAYTFERYIKIALGLPGCSRC